MTEDYTDSQSEDLDIVARATARQREAAASHNGAPPLAPWLSAGYRPEQQEQPALPFDAAPVQTDTVPADIDLTARRTGPVSEVGIGAAPDVEAAQPATPVGHPDPTGTPAEESGWFDDELDPPSAPQRPGLFERLRDAIAVQVALRRGVPDDQVEIVSGLGATPVRSRAGRRAGVPRAAVTAADGDEATGLAESHDERAIPAENAGAEAAHEYEEFRPVPVAPVVDELPVTRYEEPAITGAPPVAPPAYITHGREADDVTITHPRAPLTNFPQDALRTAISSPLRSERHGGAGVGDEPSGSQSPAPLAGRVGPTVGRARAAALAGFAAAAARRPSIDAGAVLARLRIDMRTVLAGGIVLILLLLGFVTGKHDTRLSSSEVLANTAPSAAAQPATHSAPPTAAARSGAPAPAAPTAAPGGTPLTLNNPQTLGSGATGFQVKEIRYGLHPNDYRIVVDFSGPSTGTPGTVIGFSDPTTMVVVLNQVASSGNTGTLPPGVVTSVTLQPSSTPGQTIYVFKLAHPVTVQASYVGGPTRLVIDLT